MLSPCDMNLVVGVVFLLGCVVEHMSCKSHVHIIIVMMTRDPIL